MDRPKHPKPRNVMLVCDHPIKREVEDDEKFTAPSNLNLLTALRTGLVNNYSHTPSEHKGIIMTDIFTTYLDYSTFVDGNFDYSKEVVKGKDRDVNETYYQLEHQKDVYVAERLWLQFQGLIEEIKLVQPKLIILTGKWSLFFLTGVISLVQTQGNAKDRKPFGGLVKFRSSILQAHSCFGLDKSIIVPIYHTVNAIGMPDKAPIMELDIQKLGYMYHMILEQGVELYTQPDRKLVLGTEKATIVSYLSELLAELEENKIDIAVDIETFFSSIIDCIGLAYKLNEAICIPFSTKENPNFWGEEDEYDIMLLLLAVLTHKNAILILQNGAYDAQFIKRFWFIDLKITHDTMIMSHLLYNYLPKSLDFLASIYCDKYSYWKAMQKHGKEG